MDGALLSTVRSQLRFVYSEWSVADKHHLYFHGLYLFNIYVYTVYECRYLLLSVGINGYWAISEIRTCEAKQTINLLFIYDK